MPSESWRNNPPPRVVQPAPQAQPQQAPRSIKAPADPFVALIVTVVVGISGCMIGVVVESAIVYVGALSLCGALTSLFAMALAVEWGVKRAKFHELTHWSRR